MTTPHEGGPNGANWYPVKETAGGMRGLWPEHRDVAQESSEVAQARCPSSSEVRKLELARKDPCMKSPRDGGKRQNPGQNERISGEELFSRFEISANRSLCLVWGRRLGAENLELNKVPLCNPRPPQFFAGRLGLTFGSFSRKLLGGRISREFAVFWLEWRPVTPGPPHRA